MFSKRGSLSILVSLLAFASPAIRGSSASQDPKPGLPPRTDAEQFSDELLALDVSALQAHLDRVPALATDTKLFPYAALDVVIGDRYNPTEPGPARRIAVLRLLVEHGGSLQGEGPAHTSLLHYVGTSAMARFLLEAGLPVNACNERAETPLHWVVTLGRPEVVEYLLDHGAEIGARDGSGRSPIEVAALNDRPDVFSLLHRRGAEGGAFLAAAHAGDTAALTSALSARPAPTSSAKVGALRLAVLADRPEAVRVLVRGGTDPNAGDPLGLAARSCRVEAARALLDEGARLVPEESEARGFEANPLLHAIFVKCPEMVEFLLTRGAKTLDERRSGSTLLENAIEGGDARIVALLLDHGCGLRAVDDQDAGPIVFAAEHELWPMLNQLLTRVPAGEWEDLPILHALELFAEKRVQYSVLAGLWNAQDGQGFSLLHLAAREGFAGISAALLKNGLAADQRAGDLSAPLQRAANEATARVLLDAGAHVDDVDAYHRTPLFWAQDPAVVELLLARGADSSHREYNGFTPLMRTALEGRSGVVEVLLQHGADVEARTPNGLSTLDLVARAGQDRVVQMLLACGAEGGELVTAIRDGDLAAVRRRLDARPRPPSCLFDTALWMAIRTGNFDLCRELLDRGADPNSTDEQGSSPLHLAAARGDERIAQLLFDRRSLVDSRDWSGKTPLRLASSLRDEPTIDVLLAAGADIDEIRSEYDEAGIPRDGDTGSILADAVRHGASSFVEYLLSRGASVNPKGDEDGPLFAAVHAGQAKLLELLLGHGSPTVLAPARGAWLLDVVLDERKGAELAEILLSNGVSPNEPRSEGRPLDRAERAGDTALIAVLRRHGAFDDSTVVELFANISAGTDASETRVIEILDRCPEIVNIVHERDTPLCACLRQGGSLPILLTEIQHGPDVNVRGKDGFTPLGLAVMLSEMHVGLVLAKHPEVEARIGDEKHSALMLAAFAGDPGSVRLLLENHADARASSASQKTALHWAIQGGDFPEVVSRLVSAGANVDASDSDGATPLFSAVFMKRKLSLRALVASGAKPDLAPPPGLFGGLKPLLMAIDSGDPDVVSPLLEAHASLGVVGPNGVTPLHVAATKESGAVVRLLLDAGADVNAKAANGTTPLDYAKLPQIRDILVSYGGRTSK